MNYKKATTLLELKEPVLKKNIKKAYYKLAIKYHPDKSSSNSQKFIEIKEAYDYLNTYFDVNPEETDTDVDTYIILLQKCIKLVSPNTNWSNLFMDSTFKSIINDCQNISLKIFEGLSKEKSIEIYTFLSTYKDMFHISEDTLNKMNTILKEKRKHDNLIVLRPTLKDLFNQQIYILNVCDKQFYIPLWAHQISYDISGGDLIVQCNPDLPNNVTIDEQNNIFVEIKKDIKTVLKEGVIFNLGQVKFKIDSEELLIKQKQTYALYNSGIPKFDQKDIYSVKKSNIYVNIFLN